MDLILGNILNIFIAITHLNIKYGMKQFSLVNDRQRDVLYLAIKLFLMDNLKILVIFGDNIRSLLLLNVSDHIRFYAERIVIVSLIV